METIKEFGMNIQDGLKLRSIIQGKAGQPFEWGVHDCNTFFIDIHDKLYGTTDMKDVLHQYTNRKGAIAFLKNKLKLTSAQWLYFRNYRKQTGEVEWQNGDIALIEHKIYASVYIYCNGVFWTVPEQQELLAYESSAVESQMTSAWRKQNG